MLRASDPARDAKSMEKSQRRSSRGKTTIRSCSRSFRRQWLLLRSSTPLSAQNRRLDKILLFAIAYGKARYPELKTLHTFDFKTTDGAVRLPRSCRSRVGSRPTTTTCSMEVPDEPRSCCLSRRTSVMPCRSCAR